MIFISKISKLIRAASHKRLVRNFINIHSDFDVMNIRYISFNGRTISYSFIDKKTSKKFFVKKFLYKDPKFKNIQIEEYLNIKYKLVYKLTSANLLSYSSYKLSESDDLYLRDYIQGIPLSDYLKLLNDDDFEMKAHQIISYLNQIMALMRNQEMFVTLDLHLDNIIVLNNGDMDLIDLDLGYINIDKELFEAQLFAKFFFKSISFLSALQQKILFDVMQSEISCFLTIKKLLLNRFFATVQNDTFNNFVFNNYSSFAKQTISFDSECSIKEKLIDTLQSLPQKSYVVARRYQWLLNDDIFNSKDIDIFCNEQSINEIKKCFSLNGWDVYDQRISQFFEVDNILVSIDLRSDIEERFKLKFNDILNSADNIFAINVINNYYYHEVMVHNFFHFKKFMKVEYLESLKLFLKSDNSDFSKKNYFLISKFFYKYKGNAYTSPWYLFRRILGDFMNHKDIVFIGADGAGKSTIVDVVNDNVSMVVSSTKKYLSGFYYPSGRTNLFLLKTSLVFIFLKFIKDLFFVNPNTIKHLDGKLNLTIEAGTLKTWRSVKVLQTIYAQFFLIIFLPVIVIDAWLHKLINRFGLYRIYVCDRYYDDIVINYTNPYLRKVIRFLIPDSKIKFYLYALPEVHFLRKKNEDIEMILHMQKCYSEYDNYLIKIPTNISKPFVDKKILTIALKLL